MALPLFPPESDPGPDFVGLLRQSDSLTTSGGRGGMRHDSGAGDRGASNAMVSAPHATTVVALRYADGVIMAGDRRATAGNDHIAGPRLNEGRGKVDRRLA